MNTAKAIQAIVSDYEYAITSEICKSDSIEHDLVLVQLRKRFQKLTSVANYFTENMLQSCRVFSEMEFTRPFVLQNTDAVLELKNREEKLFVGLEFENSEKAKERYVRKLVNYYSDNNTPLVLYICSSARIREAVAQAETTVAGDNSLRCFYGLLSDVLQENSDCTFIDLKGAKITVH